MASGIEMMLKMAGLDPAIIMQQVNDIQTVIKSADTRLYKIETTVNQILVILQTAQAKAEQNGKETPVESGQASGSPRDGSD